MRCSGAEGCETVGGGAFSRGRLFLLAETEQGESFFEQEFHSMEMDRTVLDSGFQCRALEVSIALGGLYSSGHNACPAGS